MLYEVITIWDERYEDIRNFEKYLSRNGVVIRKFFLHVSKDRITSYNVCYTKLLRAASSTS